MKRIVMSLSVLGMLLLAAGCDNSGMVPVEGTVTYEGEPVQGLSLEFHAVDGGRISQGYTDESGNFTLSATIHEDGALVGKHEVTCIFIADDTEEGAKMTPAIKAIIDAHGEKGTPIPIEITGPTSDLKIELPLADGGE